MHNTNTARTITALNGLRFFAVFHIFLHHVWSTRYETGLTEGQFAGVYAQLDAMPDWLVNVFAHGYISTGFFFILSGFILAYLYWAPDGQLATSRRQFWIARFARVYPAHIIVLIPTMILIAPSLFLDPNAPPLTVVAASAIATATLTQAWFPPLVPVFSWPTWALSAVVFMYLIMPWLMRVLARLNRKQMISWLIVLPAISLVPTLVFLIFFPDGAAESRDWKIFLGSTPLFWAPHFVAGMLLSRAFSLSRFAPAQPNAGSPIAFGDLAMLGLIAIAMTDPQDMAWRHILRHGTLMPLFLIVIYDFARGRGVFARLLSLPGMNALGELSFSIFIWQNFLLICAFAMVFINAATAPLALWVAIVGLLVISAISTHLIEKPLARRIRERFNKNSEPTVSTTALAPKGG
jgi:peptidoglycan/LPS O-acetylase OafA/YrhL